VHPLTPLDPPLHVAVVSAAVVHRLIIANYRRRSSANYRRLTAAWGKMRTGSASLVRSLPLCRSAGPQVRSPHFTPGLLTGLNQSNTLAKRHSHRNVINMTWKLLHDPEQENRAIAKVTKSSGYAPGYYFRSC